uniref:hypothetical protein n=1 Tax=Mesorhizobium sp. L-2-11 TaxID=2744521 RepID=UPI001FD0120A|nr:hypothetical protein [Mesorhizobium sp. L-2-11]
MAWSVHANPDADGDFSILDADCPSDAAHVLSDALGYFQCLVAASFDQEHSELLAADARRQVAFPNRVANSTAHLLEDGITDGMTKGVVDASMNSTAPSLKASEPTIASASSSPPATSCYPGGGPWERRLVCNEQVAPLLLKKSRIEAGRMELVQLRSRRFKHSLPAGNLSSIPFCHNVLSRL